MDRFSGVASVTVIVRCRLSIAGDATATKKKRIEKKKKHKMYQAWWKTKKSNGRQLPSRKPATADHLKTLSKGKRADFPFPENPSGSCVVHNKYS